MFEFAKKSLYMGLGLATMTKDRIESFAKDAAKYTKMTEDEGRKFAKFLQEESEKARADLESNVEGMVDKALKRTPCMKRIEKLEARIEALEAEQGIETAEKAEDAPEAEEVEAEKSEDSSKK